jgi:hypothetical protein
MNYFGISHFFLDSYGIDTPPSTFFLYCSIVIIFISLSSLPPTQTMREEDSSQFVTFREDLKNFSLIATHAAKNSNDDIKAMPQPFCLELACYLLEASYQAYFPPVYNPFVKRTGIDDLESPSSVVTCKLDLQRLGLKLVDIFFCPNVSVFGYLSESENGDIVVAFRGSTSENIPTDFMFSHLLLPNLEISAQFFREILSSLDELFPTFNEQTMKSKESDKINTMSNNSCFDKMLFYIPFLNQSLPQVHFGFWKSYLSIREQFLISISKLLLRKFLNYFQEESSPRKTNSFFLRCNILFSGHSLGRATSI